MEIKNSILKHLFIIFVLFLIFMLRSPNRINYNYNENYLYSPTDGNIHDIKLLNNSTFRIVYYLNLFNNHTQYIPLNSKVISIKKYNGRNYHAHSINSET